LKFEAMSGQGITLLLCFATAAEVVAEAVAAVEAAAVAVVAVAAAELGQSASVAAAEAAAAWAGLESIAAWPRAVGNS
jgi:hypothetical protein